MELQKEIESKHDITANKQLFYAYDYLRIDDNDICNNIRELKQYRTIGTQCRDIIGQIW